MKDIDKAVKWALEIASNNSHGYDQNKRNGPDYDCSSLVATALKEGGFNVNPESWTGNLYEQLIREGFAQCSYPWKKGDIHLTPGKHVAMSTADWSIVEATHNENGGIVGGKTGDQTGEEIRVVPYYERTGGWTYHLRYSEPIEHTVQKKVLSDLIQEVKDGRWGNGKERRDRLTAAGYDYDEVQKAVNESYKKVGETIKSNTTIAYEVRDGLWGNGKERRDRLTAAGYDYYEVQKIVNKLMKNGRS